MLNCKRISAENISFMKNWVMSKAAVLSWLEAAIKNHSFLKISHGNTGCRVTLLVKLQAGCWEELFLL